MEAAQKRHRTHLFRPLTNNSDDLKLVNQSEGGVASDRLRTFWGRGKMDEKPLVSVVFLHNIILFFFFFYLGAKQLITKWGDAADLHPNLQLWPPTH